MNALLGKITHISGPNQTPETGPSTRTWEVRFRAACILPRRTQAPEWLKDQTLTIRRAVKDGRELGYPGDSLVLTPAESERWLSPLAVTPAVAEGVLPPALRIRLRWWKEEKLPEFTVRANGRDFTGPFEKEGDGGAAVVETASFFPAAPSLPVTFEITCDKMKTLATVLPAGAPCYGRVQEGDGERHRLENAWFAIDVDGSSYGGAIAALREKGRDLDHFRSPEGLIQDSFEYGGHVERFRTGWDWSDKLAGVAMSCVGTRREGEATRLRLDGVVDEGQNLRTSVVYTLLDALPLLLVERAYEFHKGKAKEGEGKEKEEKPKESIDDVQALGLGFRAAWLAERNGYTGSRILCADGDRLAALRAAEVGEWIECYYWRVTDGWTLVQHPRRREHTLYLFDRKAPPHLASWLGAHAVTLEPYWPSLPVRPGETVGYSFALAAGERCGASVGGAWVACRAPAAQGGWRCAVIARLRDPASSPTVGFALGEQRREVPLQSLLVPGIGTVSGAVVTFPSGRLQDPFEAAVAGIEAL